MDLRRRVVFSLPFAFAVGLLPAAARAQDADACIAANESSLALRKAGKLIDARKALATCAAPACPEPVQSSCQQRLGDADRAVPAVVFQVKDGAGNDVTSVKITMDGQPRDERVGAAISLDPGEHTFTFDAAGLPQVKKTLVIVEGVKDRSEVVVLGAPALAPAPTPVVPAPIAHEGGGGSTQRTIGIVGGGVGVAGLAAGAIFGLMASSSWSTAQKECGATSCSQYPQASSDEQKASTYATVSTVAFIAGGVAVAAGALLWLTAPSAENPAASTAGMAIAPSLTPGGGGLLLRGGF
jgi:hypothetical protein